MSLARMVHLVTEDVERLIRLYQQLRDIPFEVQELFLLVESTYATLLEAESIISKANITSVFADYVICYKDFRGRLIELELFIDPHQILARSGPQSENYGSVGWQHQSNTTAACQSIHIILQDLKTLCRDVLLALRNEKYTPSPILAPPPRPQIAPSSLSPSSVQALLQVHHNLLSPLLSPLGSPQIAAPGSPSPISYFSLSETPYPVPVAPLPDPGLTLVNLPSSRSGKRRRRRDQTIAEKRVQQLIQSQYSQSLAAGKKRKRPEDARRSVTPIISPSISTADQLFPMSPPPGYPPSQPPLSPKLSPREVIDDTNPAWSLDDLSTALPPTTSSNAKGKQRAASSTAPSTASPSDSPDSWETSSSIHTLSSSATSVRSGSIFSVASHDRTYNSGECKIWYTQKNRLTQLLITHIEMKRASIPSGASISIYARTTLHNQIIRDDLFISSLRSNASPFFENEEVVKAMRFHDPNITCVVKMAPNPAGHPSYSFARVKDGWEFVQSVVGRTLVASVNIASVKSACTHGNSVEAGMETMQVWEDEEGNGDGDGRFNGRTVKFFRNKNPSGATQVIEFNCNTLRSPEIDSRGGKVTFRFRDVREGAIKDMKYLKIGFMKDEDRETFLHEVGFS